MSAGDRPRQPEGREARVAATVGGVLRQALQDVGASLLVLGASTSPESILLARWVASELGEERLAMVADDAVSARALAELAKTSSAAGAPAPEALVRREWLRAVARIVALQRGGVCADPSNKTALLLADSIPPEPLLPLGDLYASQVHELYGDWSAPEEVEALAQRSGGVERLDAALVEWIDRRGRPERALATLPGAVQREVIERVRGGRARRRRAGLVPKLGPRTIGIDLLW